MRVTFNEQHGGVAAMQTAASALAQAQRVVTTGKRVNVASDDPEAARKVVQERAHLSALDAYQHSADTAASRLAAADSALGGIIELYTQALASAAGGRGTTADASARYAIASAIRGIRDGVVTQINSQFGNRPLFAGSAPEGRAYEATAGGWTYNGTSSVIQLEVQRERVVAITFDGQAVLQGDDAVNILDAIDALAAAVESGDDAGVAAGMSALERAMARATRAQGRLGADEQGVADATAQLSTLRLASESRRAKAEDANLAEAITNLSAADTAYQAVLLAVSREERLSLLDYLR
jgi:flagellar hook-associated protein 3 FlgL